MVGKRRVGFEKINRNTSNCRNISGNICERGRLPMSTVDDSLESTTQASTNDAQTNVEGVFASDPGTRPNAADLAEEENKKEEEETKTCAWPCYSVRKMLGCAHVDLHEAVLDGHLETLQRTVERILSNAALGGANPRHVLNGRDDEGRTALSLAVKTNQYDVVELLLNLAGEHVDANAVDERTCASPLHHAARFCEKKTSATCEFVTDEARRENLGILSLLLERGAFVDARDAGGRTPLMIACAFGRADLALALVRAHADPELHDDEEHGWNSLFYAAIGGHADVVSLLLSEGMDKNARDNKYSARPIDWARIRKYDNVVSILEAHKSNIMTGGG